MKETILFRDSDPALHEALLAVLGGRGFRALGLDSPAVLGTAVRLFDPALLVLEGSWERGERMVLADNPSGAVKAGYLAIVLPLPGVGCRGMVVESLRKPFGLKQLLAAVNGALELRASLSRMPRGYDTEWLEVRRLTDESELETAFRLRREVYLETGYIDDRCPPLECDCLDPRSIILGAFVHHRGESELGGTLRIIRSGGDGPLSALVSRLGELHGMRSLVADGAGAPLPACESFGLIPDELEDYQPGFASMHSITGATVSPEVCELSRLAVPARWRRHRLGIERRLFDLVVVDSVASAPRRNWFVIAVHPSKRMKFHRYGFLAVNDLGVRPYAGLDQPAVLMTLDLQQYLLTPNPFTANLDQDVLLYRAGGCLVHEPGRESLAAAG
ncbi:hypothetical protein LLH00_00550 [bacterium]|nr:hypothetical protein [bacterium]